MVTPRDEHVAAVRAGQLELERKLISRIEQAMAAARKEGRAAFSVSLSDLPVGAYDEVLQPYRDAGWTVSYSSFRNEDQLDFS